MNKFILLLHNFFADEGLDIPLVLMLRAKGLNIIHALETMRGADDNSILLAAVSNKAIQLTKDKDFGEMVFRNNIPCNGIVLVRIDDLSDGRNIEMVVDFLLRFIAQLPDSFTVIQENKIRIRKLE